MKFNFTCLYPNRICRGASSKEISPPPSPGCAPCALNLPIGRYSIVLPVPTLPAATHSNNNNNSHISCESAVGVAVENFLFTPWSSWAFERRLPNMPRKPPFKSPTSLSSKSHDIADRPKITATCIVCCSAVCCSAVNVFLAAWWMSSNEHHKNKPINEGSLNAIDCLWMNKTLHDTSVVSDCSDC